MFFGHNGAVPVISSVSLCPYKIKECSTLSIDDNAHTRFDDLFSIPQHLVFCCTNPPRLLMLSSSLPDSLSNCAKNFISSGTLVIRRNSALT